MCLEVFRKSEEATETTVVSVLRILSVLSDHRFKTETSFNLRGDSMDTVVFSRRR